MKVLFLASEVAPFSKTGGLGDVTQALPAALAARGHLVWVVTPLHRGISRERLTPRGEPLTLEFPFGDVTVRFLEGEAAPHLHTFFIDAPALFDREELYGAEDDHRRYAVFSTAALTFAQSQQFAADVVHLNDWQTGLAALALKRAFQATHLARARCVFTLHNASFPGAFHKHHMDELGIPWDLFSPDGLEFHGQLSFLKAGLVYADAITTVSPTWTKELMTVDGGFGLDGLLRHRTADVHGILNGVDVDAWNPASDLLLPARFSADDFMGKEVCARAVLQRFGLPPPPPMQRRPPIFGVVGRMAEQKGVELWQQVLPWVLEQGAYAVVVGTGEEKFEEHYRALAKQFPTRLGVQVGFDEGVAHLVEAGSDFFVMPSKFEPCGLNQMYSLLYGAVPIVRATGGLEDTVVDAALPEGTGLKFTEYSAAALKEALGRAFTLWSAPGTLQQLRKRGMRQDFSWARAAKAYEAVYTGAA